MSILIKNRDTDALAREVARLKGVGLTEAVHAALERELEAIAAEPSFVERGLAFAKRLREKGDPARGKPADKAFIDSLYED